VKDLSSALHSSKNKSGTLSVAVHPSSADGSAEDAVSSHFDRKLASGGKDSERKRDKKEKKRHASDEVHRERESASASGLDSTPTDNDGLSQSHGQKKHKKKHN
jgi:hypothetical protein